MTVDEKDVRLAIAEDRLAKAVSYLDDLENLEITAISLKSQMKNLKSCGWTVENEEEVDDIISSAAFFIPYARESKFYAEEQLNRTKETITNG